MMSWNTSEAQFDRTLLNSRRVQQTFGSHGKSNFRRFYLVLVTQVSVVAIFWSNSVRVRLNSAGVQLGMWFKVSGNVSMISWNTSEAQFDRTLLNSRRVQQTFGSHGKSNFRRFYLVLVTQVSVVAIFWSNSVRVRLNSAGVQLGMWFKVSGNVSMMSWNTSEAQFDRTLLNSRRVQQILRLLGKSNFGRFYLVLVTQVSVVAIFWSNSVRVRLNSAGVQLGMWFKVSENVSMVSWNTSEAQFD